MGLNGRSRQDCLGTQVDKQGKCCLDHIALFGVICRATTVDQSANWTIRRLVGFSTDRSEITLGL